jgi:hypothetical protein
LENQRDKRLRFLVRQLNRIRHIQAKKIDILCNDLIGAQKDCIKLLGRLGFVVDAYEVLMGLTDKSAALETAAELIRPAVCAPNVWFLLLEQNNLRVHSYDSDPRLAVDAKPLTDCFTMAMVQRICASNKVCLAEDLPALGLDSNPAVFDKICLAVIPLAIGSLPLGLILVYRPAGSEFTAAELQKITAMTPGLARIIRYCQVQPAAVGSA